MTEQELARLLVAVWRCPPFRAELHASYMLEAMAYAQINTPRRLAHWLGQLGHESGRGLYTVEIWGPSPQQLRYEPTTDLSKALGNTRPGDGSRYRGRGLIQLTGRGNARSFTQRTRSALGNSTPDFEAAPRLMQGAEWASFCGADYWNSRNLNRFADADDDIGITKAINGGLTHLAERVALRQFAVRNMASS